MEQDLSLPIAFIGHRNCGKSTLAGKLIYEVKKAQGLLKALNNFYGKDVATLPPSFLVDTLPEEREKGQTLSLSTNTLITTKYEFTLYNVPGRRDLIKNMIRGTSQTDAAVLVVSALPEEFEVGMHAEGQTKWHSLIAHAFGIEQFIVCITKTDEEEAEFSEDRYNEIKKQVSECLRKIGISSEKTQFMPVSGLTGENLVKQSKRLNWYKGPTLIEAMKNFQVPSYMGDKPLRVTIQKIEKVGGSGDIIGRVQSGIITKGNSIKFAVINKPMELFSIWSSSYNKLFDATAGTTIRFKIPYEILRCLNAGDIVGREDVNPPFPCQEFTAEVVILNHPGEIKPGYSPSIYVHAAHVPCKFEEIISKTDKESGKVLIDENKTLKTGEVGLVRMSPLRDLCIEAFHNVPGLARFVIADNSRIIGTGIVKSVKFKTKKKV